MVPVNQRVSRLFETFCLGYCKYRKRDKCTKTGNKRGLNWCPIGEWWDLNEWIIDIKTLTTAMGKL